MTFYTFLITLVLYPVSVFLINYPLRYCHLLLVIVLFLLLTLTAIILLPL